MRRPRHPTYANAISSLALVVALGTGGAYAAAKLAPKSVGERQLRLGAVSASRIRKNAVTAPKVKAQAIKEGKLAAAAVSAAKLADGAVAAAKLQNGAVIAEKIADGAVTGAKVQEGTLSQVPSAARSDTSAYAEAAQPAAYAKVSAAGALDAAASRGIAAVKETEAGVYCVTVAGFAPIGAQVTPQFNGIGSTDAFARIGGAASCPSPQIEVQAWNGGVKVEAPFFLVAYR